jgi:hypothetical protein
MLRGVLTSRSSCRTWPALGSPRTPPSRACVSRALGVPGPCHLSSRAPIGEPAGAVRVPLPGYVRSGCGPRSAPGTRCGDPQARRPSSPAVVQRVGPCRPSFHPRRRADEDLSGLMMGRQKTCPVSGRREHRKTCAVEAVCGARTQPLPRPPNAPLRPKPQVTRHFSWRRRTGIEPACQLSPAHRF